MRFVAGKAAAIACTALSVMACRHDVALTESDLVDGGAEAGQDNLVRPDADTVCATAGQCTCTVDRQCIQNCPAATPTKISGTVYDPAGNNPLYNIAVYIPAKLPLPDLPGPPGAPVSCPHCPDYYPKEVVSGMFTDAKGQFNFTVPTGQNVPLVVQIGKWRHLTSISTTGCQDNPVPDKTLRLPSQAGGSDTLPQFAVSTGGADSLECLLKRVGVADSEYANGAGGTGHIHIFQGGGGGNVAGPTMQGGSPLSPVALWPSAAELRKYDVVILSCEGGETAGVNPTALSTYADNGGRVFASHFHYAWFTAPNGPFFNDNLASWRTQTQDLNDINALIQTGFNGGMQMHDWLKNVGALTNDELRIVQARYNATVSASNPSSRSWIVADPSTAIPGSGPGTAAGATEYFSFDTPITASVEQKCGRVVYSDLHVGAASKDYGVSPGQDTTGGIVPSGCANVALSPQERALEYMLFDLTACFTPPDQPTASTWLK
jgi:hypothetical protein